MASLGEAIVMESTVLSLKPPSSRVLKTFQNVFNNVGSDEEEFPVLGGDNADTYNENDLIMLKAPTDEDRLTSFLRNYFPQLFIVS
jgi:hypothetical protein